jgi:hypothetical protein
MQAAALQHFSKKRCAWVQGLSPSLIHTTQGNIHETIHAQPSMLYEALLALVGEHVPLHIWSA